ncbi:MAG: hypothetical protein ACE5OZ_20150 [Candidatus Heimdallarchaeota archaeon]
MAMWGGEAPPDSDSQVLSSTEAEWGLFANVTGPYFVGARSVSALVNRPLTELQTREAFTGVFWNATSNVDIVVCTTSLRLINQLLSPVTQQAPSFRAG